jgi:hypothetical protein
VSADGASVLLGNGDGTFRSPLALTTVTYSTWVVAADFNQDGNLDLAVTGQLNNADNNLGVLLGNGDGSFQGVTSYAVGHQAIGLAVGDFNGDGYPDLVAVNITDNTISVLLNGADWAGGSPGVRPKPRIPAVQPAGHGQARLDPLAAQHRAVPPLLTLVPSETTISDPNQRLNPAPLVAVESGGESPAHAPAAFLSGAMAPATDAVFIPFTNEPPDGLARWDLDGTAGEVP